MTTAVKKSLKKPNFRPYKLYCVYLGPLNSSNTDNRTTSHDNVLRPTCLLDTKNRGVKQNRKQLEGYFGRFQSRKKVQNLAKKVVLTQFLKAR